MKTNQKQDQDDEEEEQDKDIEEHNGSGKGQSDSEHDDDDMYWSDMSIYSMILPVVFSKFNGFKIWFFNGFYNMILIVFSWI